MGWDIDRFPGEVDSELICCICTGVLQDPVESPCRHVFCTSCVKPWINKNSTCPQCRGKIYEKDLKPVVPILKNIIDKQKICCEYKENGCEEVVTIEALQRHLEKCSFEPLKGKKVFSEHRFKIECVLHFHWYYQSALYKFAKHGFLTA